MFACDWNWKGKIRGWWRRGKGAALGRGTCLAMLKVSPSPYVF